MTTPEPTEEPAYREVEWLSVLDSGLLAWVNTLLMPFGFQILLLIDTLSSGKRHLQRIVFADYGKPMLFR